MFKFGFLCWIWLWIMLPSHKQVLFWCFNCWLSLKACKGWCCSWLYKLRFEVIDLDCFVFDFEYNNMLAISYGFGDQAWVDLFLTSSILFMYNSIKKWILDVSFNLENHLRWFCIKGWIIKTFSIDYKMSFAHLCK